MIAPATDGRTIVNKRNAFNGDIIRVLESNFAAAKENVKSFAMQFTGRTDKETAQNVWNFLKHNVPYKRDPENRQLIRMPGRMIADGRNGLGADCKSFALSACSMLANLGFKTSFRYTSYNDSNTPTHVYCIAERNGIKYIVDPVYHSFNSEKHYKFKIDHKMNIETLSGINGNGRMRLDVSNKMHLQKVYNRLPNKNSLVAKIIEKRMSGGGSRVNYSPEQLNQYRNRLQTKLSTATTPFVRAILQDELNQLNTGRLTGGIFGTGEDHSIGKIGKGRLKKALKKIGKGLKKVGLSVPRASFLALVKLNFRNMARSLAAANQSKLKHAWEKLGGDYNKLKTAFSQGAKRKMIGGYDETGVGSVAAVAGALESASVIIAALASFFKKKPGETLEAGEASTAENLLNTFDNLKSAAIDAGVLPSKLTEADTMAEEITTGKAEVSDNEAGFGAMLPLIVGGGALLFMANKN